MATVASSRTKIEDEKIDVEAVSSDEEEHVHDENCQHSTTERIPSRKERAALKELLKAGKLTLLPHIKRVTFKRHNGPVFAISNAKVYYDATSGCHAVFGQPMIETGGLNAQAAQRAAEQATDIMPSSKITVQDDDEQDGDNADVDNKEQEEGLDATGLDEKDIAIVMDQAHVSRAKAIKALRANGNDIVNTIMELTM